MPKRSSVGRSMYARHWSSPKVQPEFDDPKIRRGFRLAKKLMEN